VRARGPAGVELDSRISQRPAGRATTKVIVGQFTTNPRLSTAAAERIAATVA
jgi:hypothetical protein